MAFTVDPGKKTLDMGLEVAGMKLINIDISCKNGTLLSYNEVNK